VVRLYDARVPRAPDWGREAVTLEREELVLNPEEVVPGDDVDPGAEGVFLEERQPDEVLDGSCVQSGAESTFLEASEASKRASGDLCDLGVVDAKEAVREAEVREVAREGVPVSEEAAVGEELCTASREVRLPRGEGVHEGAPAADARCVGSPRAPDGGQLGAKSSFEEERSCGAHGLAERWPRGRRAVLSLAEEGQSMPRAGVEQRGTGCGVEAAEVNGAELGDAGGEAPFGEAVGSSLWCLCTERVATNGVDRVLLRERALDGVGDGMCRDRGACCDLFQPGGARCEAPGGGERRRSSRGCCDEVSDAP